MISSLFLILFVMPSLGYVCLNTRFLKSASVLNKVTSLPMAAITSLIKKGKMKEVEELLRQIEAEGDDHFLAKFLKTLAVDENFVGKPYNFFNSTTTNYDSLTVMPEYNKKSKNGFLLGMPEPEIVGGILRDAGARAIAVEMDIRSGGVPKTDFIRFVKEQYRARKMVPGPIPILWSDYIVDKLQIAYAASLGAAAVTLNPEYLSKNLDEMVNYCITLNIEPVVLVKTLEEAEIALQTKTRSLCLHSLDESELISLRSKLPDNARRNYQYIAKLRPSQDFSTYAEIDSCWLLRDSGFNCAWPTTEAVFAEGLMDVYSAVMAMKSKASRQFLSPRQFMMDRKKEGAKEYLGDILY